MEPQEPRKMIVHTGALLAQELAAEQKSDSSKAASEGCEEAGTPHRSRQPASPGSVELFKLILALLDVAVFVSLLAYNRAHPTQDAVVGVLTLVAMAFLAVLFVVLFFVQAAVATILLKLQWSFWPLALMTLLVSPLLIALVLMLNAGLNWVLQRPL